MHNKIENSINENKEKQTKTPENYSGKLLGVVENLKEENEIKLGEIRYNQIDDREFLEAVAVVLRNQEKKDYYFSGFGNNYYFLKEVINSRVEVLPYIKVKLPEDLMKLSAEKLLKTDSDIPWKKIKHLFSEASEEVKKLLEQKYGKI